MSLKIRKATFDDVVCPRNSDRQLQWLTNTHPNHTWWPYTDPQWCIWT